jgi:hypothetical protein
MKIHKFLINYIPYYLQFDKYIKSKVLYYVKKKHDSLYNDKL